MYMHSTVEINVKIPVRVTRTVEKIVFKKATKCTGKYLNSPYYKGNLLWDKLDHGLQHADNVQLFVKGLEKLYVVYQEIW